ncbi:MAG: hypothetical protein RSD78_08320 [Oscillospiraceae bacterium]
MNIRVIAIVAAVILVLAIILAVLIIAAVGAARSKPPTPTQQTDNPYRKFYNKKP